MFILWLIKRMAKPVIDEWDRPAHQGGDHISGKERFYTWGLFSIWIIVLILIIRRAVIDENPWLSIVAVASFVLFYVAVFVPDAYRYLSKLYTQYRAEQPEKPKRKRPGETELPDCVHLIDGMNCDFTDSICLMCKCYSPDSEKPKRKRHPQRKTNKGIPMPEVEVRDYVPDDEIWVVSQNGDDVGKITNIGDFFENESGE